jgi:hypothetical protein
MECNTCGREIPKNKLACPSCVEAKGRYAILDRQRDRIPLIVTSKSSVTLRKSATSKTWHIKLPSYEQAWCGMKIQPGWRDRKAEYWSLLPVGETCSDCIGMIESMQK